MLIATLLALAALQDAAAAPATDATVAAPEKAADGTQRWSILADVCGREGADIVVCGKGVPPLRLPLPEERGPPDRPMPGNPNVDGKGALAMTIDPCATRSEGCSTGINLLGIGTLLVRAAGKVVDPDSCCEEPGEATNVVLLGRDVVRAVKRGARGKVDKSNRVPITFDDLPPPSGEEPEPVTVP